MYIKKNEKNLQTKLKLKRKNWNGNGIDTSHQHTISKQIGRILKLKENCLWKKWHVLFIKKNIFCFKIVVKINQNFNYKEKKNKNKNKQKILLLA